MAFEKVEALNPIITIEPPLNKAAFLLLNAKHYFKFTSMGWNTSGIVIRNNHQNNSKPILDIFCISKNGLIIITAILVSTSLFAQKSKTSEEYKNQKNSVAAIIDWQGIYFGITNCANCEGIETELVLQKGNKYILSTKPKNTTQSKFINKGSFKWDGDIIILQGITVPEMAFMYKIEKNQVRQLYLIDNKIRGENWTGYILKKQ